MQKKILAVLLTLFMAGFAGSAFAQVPVLPTLDIELDDSFNESYDFDTDIDLDLDIDWTRDNDVIDVDNGSGTVLNQISNQTPGFGVPGYVENGNGGRGFTQQMSGNVAAQASLLNGDIEGSVVAVGNALSINGSYNHTHTGTIDIGVDIDIEDSFTADDSFNTEGSYNGLPFAE